MRHQTSWEDLRLFSVVAQASSLREAARTAGASAATLSRRIDALERSLGVALLVRDVSGLALTPTGRDVLVQVERMHVAARDIARVGRTDVEVVRIAAGFWSARFFGARLPAVLAADPPPVSIEWLAGSARLDIERRDAHVGLRNARPVEDALAARRLMRVEFAIYRARGSVRSRAQAEWIVAGEASMPSTRWMERDGDVAARVSNPALLLPLLQADAGLGVLPTFAGDAEGGLERVGTPIDELAHEQWLVAHADDRHLPAVRRTLDALVLIATRDGDAPA